MRQGFHTQPNYQQLLDNVECRNGSRAPFGQEQIVAQCQQVAGLRAHLGVQIPLGVAVDAAEVIANLLKQAVVVCGAIRPGRWHGDMAAM